MTGSGEAPGPVEAEVEAEVEVAVLAGRGKTGRAVCAALAEAGARPGRSAGPTPRASTTRWWAARRCT